jgi:hypothetical protein
MAIRLIAHGTGRRPTVVPVCENGRKSFIPRQETHECLAHDHDLRHPHDGLAHAGSVCHPVTGIQKPLSDLKVRTLLVYSARSTQLPFKELIRAVKRLLLW